ncbi:MFS transporter [Cellulomonas sp. ACRRI]|uniref:MFS transporter n=1 Tax=Cellulomonas sp. ACRRI TaxID=2918188 RepID=UPI001EF225FA|nr:MFS transporter [Cellulomonas sp. ACRRI]MCG7284759.1 MFS transporter [Cellulomonas sp. ACRRI]
MRILATGQVLSGVGTGAAVSTGALLVSSVTGSSAWSGMASTANTLGAALAAVPLAVLAQRHGRRPSLTGGAVAAAAGAALVVLGAGSRAAWLVVAAMIVMGTGTALSFQARFAATDLSTDTTRGKDLSLVVWATTVGAVAGPNLTTVSDTFARSLGLPELTGGFVIAAIAQLAGALVYFAGLRPDPLVVACTAQAGVAEPGNQLRGGAWRVLASNVAARRAVLAVAGSHAVMVALMSMAPVHLTDHGGSLTSVGVTISLHVAGMFALSPVFGALVDRLGATRVILIGQGLLLLALATAFFSADRQSLVTFSLLFLGLGWSAATVAGSTRLSEAVELSRRTKVQGTSDLLMNLAGAVGGAAAGPILAQVGFDGLAGVLVIVVLGVVAGQLRRG